MAKKKKGITRKELHDIFLAARDQIAEMDDLSHVVKQGLIRLMDTLAECACDDPTDPGGPC